MVEIPLIVEYGLWLGKVTFGFCAVLTMKYRVKCRAREAREILCIRTIYSLKSAKKSIPILCTLFVGTLLPDPFVRY